MLRNIISLPIAILANFVVLFITGVIYALIHDFFYNLMLIKPYFIDENISLFFPLLMGLIAGQEVLKKINPTLLKLFQIIYFVACILFYFLGLFYSFLDYLILIIVSIGFIYKITQNSPDK